MSAQSQNKSLMESYLTLSLAIVVATLALTPSALGLVKNPHILKWFPAISIGLLTISIVLLGTSRFRVIKVILTFPVRLMGLGNWSGMFGICLLAAYVIANLGSDLHSIPEITAIHASPAVLECGASLELGVEYRDPRDDKDRVQWFLGKRDIGHLRSFPFIAPKIPGMYEVRVQVSNEIGTTIERSYIEVRNPTGK